MRASSSIPTTTTDASTTSSGKCRCARQSPHSGLGMPHEKKGIVDLYDVGDDWIPIYDRTDLDGFYVASVRAEISTRTQEPSAR